jgi:hypothetical protein
MPSAKSIAKLEEIVGAIQFRHQLVAETPKFANETLGIGQ